MSAYLPDGVVAINSMFMYAWKWTLMNTPEGYMAGWAVLGVMSIPDVYFNPNATHAPVAYDSPLFDVLSLVVKHNLHFKYLDVRTAFLKFFLEHDVWVRFPNGYVHPIGRSFTKLQKSWYVLR